MISIHINNKSLHLKTDTTVKFSLVFPDPTQESLPSSLVQWFDIPIDEHNDSVLNHSRFIDVANKVRIYENVVFAFGIIQQKGTMLVKSATAKFYKISFTFNPFPVEFKDKLITELSYPEYNIGSDTATIIANAKAYSQLSYPYADFCFPEIRMPNFYGDTNPYFSLWKYINNYQDDEYLTNGYFLSTIQNKNALVPFFYLKSIFESILAEVGYDVKGKFIRENMFSQIVIANNYALDFVYKDVDIATAKTNSEHYFLIPTGSVSTWVSHKLETDIEIDPDSRYDLPNNEYVIDKEGPIEVQVKLDFKHIQSGPPDAQQIKIIVAKNGNSEEANAVSIYLPIGDDQYSYYDATLTYTGSTSLGDTLAVYFDFYIIRDNYYYDNYYKNVEIRYNPIAYNNVNIFTGNINPANHIPKISVSNFVNTIVKAFTLAPFADISAKNISFELWKDILSSEKALDLTDKAIEGTEQVELHTKTYTLKLQDNEELNKQATEKYSLLGEIYTHEIPLNFMSRNANTIKIAAKLIAILTTAIVSYRISAKLATIWTNRLRIAEVKKLFVEKAALIMTKVRRVAVLALATAQAALTLNVTKLKKAYRLLSVAMKANPIGLIAAAVVSAYTAYRIFSEEVNKASASQQVLTDVTVTAQKEVAKQKLELEKLLIVARDETKSKSEREKAMRMINRLSPEYLGNLKLEEINTEKAKTALNSYIASLEKRIKLQATHQKLLEIEKEMIELMAKTGESAGTWEEIKSIFTGEMKIKGSDRIRELREMKEALLDYLKAEDDLIPEKKATDKKVSPVITYESSTDFKKAKKAYKDFYKEIAEIREKAGLEKLTEEEKQLFATKKHFEEMLTVLDTQIAELEAKKEAKKGLNQEETDLLTKFYYQQVELTNLYQDELTRVQAEAENKRIAARREAEQRIADVLASEEEREIKAVTEKYEELIALAVKYGLDTVDLYEKMNQELAEIREKYAQGEDIDVIFGMTADELEKWKERVYKIIGYVDKVGEAWSSINSIRANQEEREMQRYEANTEKRKALLDKQLAQGYISEKNYNLRIEALDKQLEAKKQAIALRQAKRDKASAIFKAGVDTASAVAEALPNIPLSIAVGVLGGLQIAAIASEPLPAYGDGGRINHPHMAIVGEKGPEIMMSNKMLTDPIYGPVVEDLARVQEGTMPRFLNQPVRPDFAGMNKALTPSASEASNSVTNINQVDTKGMQRMTSEVGQMRTELKEVTEAVKSIGYLKAVISQRQLDDRYEEEELLKYYSNF